MTDPLRNNFVQSVGAARFPDSIVLWDDNFGEGFCGWEELYNAPTSDFTTGLYSPLTLSCHGMFSKYALMLQTNNTASVSYGSQSCGIRRGTFQQHPGDGHRILDYETWWSYGGVGYAMIAGLSGNGSPAKIDWGIDVMSPSTGQTSISPGNRAYFQAEWRQIDSPNTTRERQLYLGLTLGAYGDSGYKISSNNLVPTGYFIDFPYNQNKRNLQYCKLTVDATAGVYLSLTANSQTYDLTNCPSGLIAGGTVLSPGDTSYNDINFSGGLNTVMTILNAGITNNAASYLELHRARLAMR